MSFGDDNQRVENAVRRAREELTEGVNSEETEITVCPKCRHATLVTASGQGDYCFYCQEECKMARCTACHGFVAEEETNEFGLCEMCSRHGSVIVP